MILYKHSKMKYVFLFLTVVIFLIGIIPNFVYAESIDDDKSKPAKFVDISFAISFGAVLLIMYAASKIIKRGKGNLTLLDIIRDRDWYPSLSIFQFFMWTFVVLFAFFGIYLFRVFNGVTEPPTDIPESLLILMGISFVVPVTSSGISSIRYVSGEAGNLKPPKANYLTIQQCSMKMANLHLQDFRCFHGHG